MYAPGQNVWTIKTPSLASHAQHLVRSVQVVDPLLAANSTFHDAAAARMHCCHNKRCVG